jgi:hypothetical protein
LIIDSEHPVLPTLTNQFSTGRCPSGVGAIEIVSRSSRIAARIYVNDRKVYGIDISNFPLEVIRRIITSEHISETNRNILLNVFSENLADPKVVDYILENQMIPPSVLVVYLKDIFLGACDYVASIPHAEISWRPSVVPKSTPVPEVDLDKLWNVVSKRRAEFIRMAQLFGLDEGKVRNLKFKRVENVDTQISQLIANIYSLATGEWTLLDFARQFGISLFLATREIQNLWVNKKINVIYDNEFKLTPPKVIANVSVVPTSMKAKETAATFLPPRPENVKKNPSTDMVTSTPIPVAEATKETPEEFITNKDANVKTTAENLGLRIASSGRNTVKVVRSMDESESIISKIRKELKDAKALIEKSLEELDGLE